jgi:hypothetical protein
MLDKFTGAPWVQDHPNLLKGIAVGASLILMALLLAWQMNWLQGTPEATPADANRPPQAAEQKQPPAGAQPAPPAAKTPPATKAPEVPKTADKQNVKPEGPRPLPDDVSQWKKEDYFRARVENNPKLVEAVARLGEKTRGSIPAAQGLIALLMPLPPMPPPGAGPPAAAPGTAAAGSPRPAPTAGASPGPAPAGAGMQPAPGSPTARPRNPADLQKLVEAIISTLGDNGTEPAQKTLELVLSGALATDDDKAAVEAALKALVAHPGPANDALLVRVITAPEVLRPANRQGPWPAKELRSKALELIKAAASIDLRMRLAEAMGERLSKLGDDDPVRALLLAAEPANCGAQAVFLEQNVFSKEINAKLEQQLASYSAVALARVLNVSSDVQPGIGGGRGVASAGNASNANSADLSFRVAQLLWSEKFGASLIPRLAEGHSLEKQADIVLLAATIPQDPLRVALAKTLRKRWPEGPAILGTGDSANKTVTDPALVVLLKAFPRRGEAKAGVRPPPARSRPGRTPPNGAAAAGKSTLEKKEQAEKDWTAFLSKLVSAWCARLQAAARARDKAEAEAGTLSANAAARKLPPEFEMAHGAKVVTTYHLVWPAEAPAELAAAKPGPLEVYYLRIEETNKPKKAISYYQRQFQVKNSEVRKTDSNKTDWLDNARTLASNNHRRSVDVLVTRADSKSIDTAKDKDNEETDLVVDILTIEIKDPATRE